MALSSLHLLSAIVPALPSDTSCLHRLAVHDARTRLGISLHADAQTLSDSGMQLLPGTVDAPGSEVVVDGFPGWEAMREQAPGAATLEYVEEDGIEDFAGI